jgi:uncharacterized oligopeptide transporter (OPT) family protein
MASEPAPDAASATGDTRKFRWLPPPNSRGYHVLLAAVAMLVLGPLGGLTSSFMFFSLGFAVGGQVLAGILGSSVTYGYGAEGKHGANYIQTMAASVASMAGLGVLIQAMVWLGMPMPPAWKLVLYFGCIGMFGIGVGMLYTPILVDRLQLEYPSGHAVANILRALTDPNLLRRSILKLGGGAVGGIAGGFAGRVPFIETIGLSTSTLGAGLIVGSRIGVPAFVMAAIGYLLTPYLRAIDILGPKDPFRKVGFLVGLAMIFGAGIVDLTFIAIEAVRRVRARASASASASAAPAPSQSGGLSMRGLALWVLFWGIALTLVATLLLGQPIGYVLFAIVLVFLFVFINGISQGISDWNPISSAFVVSVLLMSAIGLRDPTVAMMAASVLLVSCLIGVDMQQDRSTGWRLGSNRAIQFRYQAGGIVMGCVLCVVLAEFFMNQYDVLRVDLFAHPDTKTGIWKSAMTYKFVGAIRGIGHLAPFQVKALTLGLCIGVFIAVARRGLTASNRYQRFIKSGAVGFTAGWIVDAVLLASPYASSTGGFLDLTVSTWFAGGSLLTWFLSRPPAPAKGAAKSDIPADMSTASLIGGGLIAGESLYYLGLGLASLFSVMLLR